MSGSPNEGVKTSTSHSASSTPVPDTAPRKHAVVLGMHRSGTSLTARLLGDLGWHLGRPDELLGPREDNPDGFFERADVQVVNDRILSQLGASWDGPPAPEEFDEFDEAQVDDELEGLVTRLAADAGSAPFALKDPRLCVLWPLWERHLPRSAALILAFRHPAEVAASLYTRDGIPVPTGLALWEEYVRRALAAAEDRAAVVVRYQDLLAHPESSVEALAQALGATVPATGESAIRPELYRSRGDNHEDLLTPSQRKLWSWIEQAPTSVDRIDASDIPDRTGNSSVSLLRDRRRAFVVRRESEQLQRSLEETRSELDQRTENQSELERSLHEREATLRAAVDQRDEAVRSLRSTKIEHSVLRDQLRHHETARRRQEQQIQRDADRIARLTDELASTDLFIEALRQRRLELSERIETMRLESVETHSQLERVSEELAAKGQVERVAEAREQVLRHQREQLFRTVTVVEAERRSQEAALVMMRSSRTWRWGRKLSAPMRWMSPRGEDT